MMNKETIRVLVSCLVIGYACCTLSNGNSERILFSGGPLLDISQQLKLNEFYGIKDQQWKLLYKATRDGFSVATFHKLCDDKGPTMTVIKSSEGWLFGGFTTQSWRGAPTWRADPQAFIFTLTNPHNIPATKFDVKLDKQDFAVCANSRMGPTFGTGPDIYVSHNSNMNTNSRTVFPTTFEDSTGIGESLFTGNDFYIAGDVEVYTI